MSLLAVLEFTYRHSASTLYGAGIRGRSLGIQFPRCWPQLTSQYIVALTFLLSSIAGYSRAVFLDQTIVAFLFWNNIGASPSLPIRRIISSIKLLVYRRNGYFLGRSREYVTLLSYSLSA